MKTSRAVRTLQCVILSGASMLPLAAHAADWVGETGLFGDDENWSTGFVPVGEPANIWNGGTAQVVEGDDFFTGLLSVGGNAGTGTLEISGGTLTIVNGPHNAYIGGDDVAGGTGVGTLTMSGGMLAGTGGEMLFGSRGGTANVTMTGGAITNDNWIIFGRDGGGTANVDLGGTAEILKTGVGNLAIGIFSGTTSTMTLSDSASISSNNEIRVGWGNGAGTRGVLEMSGESTASADGNFIVALRDGGSDAPSGELRMSGAAEASAGNEFYIGNLEGADATLTMADDSKITVTNGFVVGRFNSTGIATVNGNAEIDVGGVNVVGDGALSSGSLEVNGGFVHSAMQLWLGLNGATSTVTINGGVVRANAVLDETSPLFDATGAGVSFTRFGDSGNGTLNLNGGTLETPGFSKYAGTAQINLNGGTLRATGMTTTGSFFDNFESSEIAVQAGGARFDTNGHTITIVQDLSGIGGLVKRGAGDLILAGAVAYMGDTVVEAGTLTITSGTLADEANVWLSTGSVFDLDFVGTDTVNALFIDGVAQELGTWGGMESTADHKSDLFSGAGVIAVTSMVPEPSTLALLGIAAAGGWAIRRRRSRAS